MFHKGIQGNFEGESSSLSEITEGFFSGTTSFTARVFGNKVLEIIFSELKAHVHQSGYAHLPFCFRTVHLLNAGF